MVLKNSLTKGRITRIVSMQADITHNYSIFKRISTLILLVACLAIGLNIYLMHSRNADQWYAIESEQLGRSLTQQAAKLVAAPLANEDTELLDQYIELVNQGMFVQDAVMFNQFGVRYAQIGQRISVLDMLRTQDIEPLVFVEDIVYEGSIIGYIKLVLDKQAVTHHHRSFNRNQMSQTLLIVILCIIVAGLSTRLFYKARANYRLNDTSDEATRIV